MQHDIRHALILLLIAATLAGCRQMPATRPDAETGAGSPSQVAVSGEAQAALRQAESEVQAARERFALWTTAEEALLRAREAAQAGDSAATIRHAARASDQARKGLDQLAYPSTELP